MFQKDVRTACHANNITLQFALVSLRSEGFEENFCEIIWAGGRRWHSRYSMGYTDLEKGVEKAAKYHQ